MSDGSTNQLDLFNSAESARRRDAAIDRVEANAEPDWSEKAFKAVKDVALMQNEFTTDDVWALLDDAPHEPRAMGGIMRQAVRARLCVATDRTVKSSRVACHRRPITVWKSLVR